jgi:hypothetical protein
MRHSAKSIFIIEYLRKYETALVHESVEPGVLFADKLRGSKISWYRPLKAQLVISVQYSTEHCHSHTGVSRPALFSLNQLFKLCCSLILQLTVTSNKVRHFTRRSESGMPCVRDTFDLRLKSWQYPGQSQASVSLAWIGLHCSCTSFSFNPTAVSISR